MITQACDKCQVKIEATPNITVTLEDGWEYHFCSQGCFDRFFFYTDADGNIVGSQSEPPSIFANPNKTV